MKVAALFFLALAGLVGVANGETSSDYDAAKTAIWSKELAIYDAWAKTGLDYYIANASANYVGWPPGSKKPSSLADLKGMQSRLVLPNQERREITFDDLALQGDTAVLYYTTHRTMLPDGTPVDELLHICHVWVRDDAGNWKLLGALGRVERD